MSEASFTHLPQTIRPKGISVIPESIEWAVVVERHEGCCEAVARWHSDAVRDPRAASSDEVVVRVRVSDAESHLLETRLASTCQRVHETMARSLPVSFSLVTVLPVEGREEVR